MRLNRVVAILIVSVLVVSCASAPTATPTLAPTRTMTTAPTLTATNVPTSTPRATETSTPTATATLRPTATPTVTWTPAPVVPQLKLPADSIRADHIWMSGATSEFDLKVSRIGGGYDVWDGNYPGWCLEDNYQHNTDTVRLYSSYDPNMPDDIRYYRDPTIPKGALSQLVPWDKLNYLLNHKQGSLRDVGAAIWLLIWGATYHFPASPPAQAMVANAETNGSGFVPQPRQIMAIILYADGLGNDHNRHFQDTIIEYTVPLTPTRTP